MITTCLNGSRQVDLTVTGCKLHGATTAPAGNLLKDPGFEAGAVNWTGSSGVVSQSGPGARTGTWKAWLGGYGSTATETLQQSVTIPATATSATLSLWTSITTEETTTATVYDRLRVQVVDGSATTTLATYSNLNKSAGYVQRTLDLSAYKGKTISVRFLMIEDSSLETTFAVDDTAVSVG